MKEVELPEGIWEGFAAAGREFGGKSQNRGSGENRGREEAPAVVKSLVG